MRRIAAAATTSAALVGGALLLRRRARSSADADERWLVVTINRSPDEVAPRGQVPEQLVALGDAVEVQVRPAPADHGTELAARPRKRPTRVASPLRRVSGSDPRQDVRRALREAKQVLEVGEVVRANEPGSTRRTLLGLPIDLAVRRSGEEGRL